jgi:uncharacterized protein YodC (DUF2158 family)
MTNKFETGQVVELRSRGGEMTVEEANGKSVSCVWRTQGGERQEREVSASVSSKTTAGSHDGEYRTAGNVGMKTETRYSEQFENNLLTIVARSTVASSTQKQKQRKR